MLEHKRTLFSKLTNRLLCRFDVTSKLENNVPLPCWRKAQNLENPSQLKLNEGISSYVLQLSNEGGVSSSRTVEQSTISRKCEVSGSKIVKSGRKSTGFLINLPTFHQMEFSVF